MRLLKLTPRSFAEQLAIALLLPACVGAQDQPPDPLPESGTLLPRVESVSLSMGTELFLVGRAQTPFVAVRLIIRDVVSVDSTAPGVAAVVARLLRTGTTTRNADQFARAVDQLGAVLDATAGPDGTTITLGVAREHLGPGLELMADMVMRPSLEAAALEPLLDEIAQGADARRFHPPTLATRTLLGRVYGRHRYGRGAGEELLGGLDAEALGAYHAANYSPGSATFVAAGGVSLEDMAEGIEEHFGGWTASSGAGPAGIALPERQASEVVLVNVPGVARATVRVGHLLPAGSDPDWTALVVANSVLRERLVSVSSIAHRRVDQGYYVAGVEVPSAAADSVVGFILDHMERLRSEEVPPEELSANKGFLAAAFALQVETPQQIVVRVARDHLLGVPSEWLGEYPSRVRGLDGADIRRVAFRHLRPDRAVITVVGDASVLRGPLTKFGLVTVIDASGRPLELADLSSPQEQVRLDLDASGLEDGSLIYGMTVDGERVGEMIRTIERSDPADSNSITVTSTMVTGPQTLRQEVTFRASTFEPVSASFTLAAQGAEMGAHSTVQDGLVRGSRKFPDGRVEEFQAQATPGGVMGEMLELALWLSDLVPGRAIAIPVTQVESGVTTTLRARVLDVTSVEVPAGTFQAYRVEIVSEAGEQILYARTEAPHIVLQLETRGQPLVIQLEFISGL